MTALNLQKTVWLLCLVANAQEVVAPKTISVCEVLQNPTKFNHAIIAVRGIYTAWEHGLALSGEGCDGILVSQGFKWPSMISIVRWQKEIESRGRSIAASQKVDEELGAAIRRAVQAKGIGARTRRVRLTYVGLFETHDDLDARPGDGFGALNAAPGQLFVDAVKDIEVEFE